MPSRLPFVVAYRGTEEYRAALAELAEVLGLDGPNEVAQHAIEVLARRKKIAIPRPATPPGKWKRAEDPPTD